MTQPFQVCVKRWHSLNEHIRSLEQQSQRPAHCVRLLAVSKNQPLNKIQALSDAGQQDFGENYLADALPKISALSHKNIVWHYIGQLQSRKIPEIAQHFSWVHGICRVKEAQKLNYYRNGQKPLQVCIQVNTEKTEHKSGIDPESLESLTDEILALPNLQLRGLMTMPDMHSEPSAQAAPFRELRHCLERLNHHGLSMDTLSMGTSHDYPTAIAQGATLIRIGQSLFGSRSKQ